MYNFILYKTKKRRFTFKFQIVVLPWYCVSWLYQSSRFKMADSVLVGRTGQYRRSVTMHIRDSLSDENGNWLIHCLYRWRTRDAHCRMCHGNRKWEVKSKYVPTHFPPRIYSFRVKYRFNISCVVRLMIFTIKFHNSNFPFQQLIFFVQMA